MTSRTATEALRTGYTLSHVEKTDAPEGGEDGSWYRYVITRNGSDIVGQRSGTRQQVTSYAHSVIENLNARASGRSSYAVSRRTKKSG